jgi:hypothetical protein
MKRALIILISFTLYTIGYGQYNLCDCCTYETLNWTEDFEKWFPAENIKKNNYHELTIYTTSKKTSKEGTDMTVKIIDQEYREMILRFNDDGFVTERIFFNQLGQYHSTDEFVRNSNNQVITKTFFYLDSTGVKEDFLIKKWMYSYENGKLIKSKLLGNNFIELPDSQSQYFIYVYDPFDRITETTHYTYYEQQATDIIQSSTKYKGTNSSITKTTYEGILNSTEKTTYNADKNPVKEIQFNKGKKIGTTVYDYDNRGRLIRLQITSTGAYTECKDGGNLAEFYAYTDSNILTAIEHRYKNVVCSLKFEFR